MDGMFVRGERRASRQEGKKCTHLFTDTAHTLYVSIMLSIL